MVYSGKENLVPSNLNSGLLGSLSFSAFMISSALVRPLMSMLLPSPLVAKVYVVPLTVRVLPR